MTETTNNDKYSRYDSLGKNYTANCNICKEETMHISLGKNEYPNSNSPIAKAPVLHCTKCGTSGTGKKKLQEIVL